MDTKKNSTSLSKFVFFYYQKRPRVTDLSYFYRHHSLFWLLLLRFARKVFLLILTCETWFERNRNKIKFFLRLFFQPTVTMNLNAEKKLFFLMFKNRHFKITICEMDWTEYVTILMLISFHTKLFKFFWKEKSRISRLLLRRNSTRVLKEENKEN